MKNPTYAQFMNKVENIISTLSEEQLKEKIMNFAESQPVSNRNNFLQLLKQGFSSEVCSEEKETALEVTPQEFIEQIEEYSQRILNGDYFDEDESWRARDREDHSHWGSHYDDYYDDQIDFTKEPYVFEALELLEQAKVFFRKGDIETAYEAYGMLFDIFENPDYYDDGCFIYGFSFEESIDKEVLREHRTMYLRCLYLQYVKKNNFKVIFSILTAEKDILLSDIIEIARTPLPKLDKVILELIDNLKGEAKYDRHLIDVLFIKGGIREIKSFAYENGKEHPPVFLYYYQYAKEQNFPESDLLKLILDGINMIPQKYRTRSLLSLDLIEMAKKTNNKENLTLGYSTAFYSDPSLKNMTYYLNFIISEKNENESKKLKKYLSKKNIKDSSLINLSFYRKRLWEDIYSLNSSNIDCQTLVIGRYILEGIDPFLDFINPKDYLGFNGNLAYVAVTVSLTLKSISQLHKAFVTDKLVEHYCLDKTSEERVVLIKLISNKANSLPAPQTYLLTTLEKIEKLAVNRVTHILKNKLRGGYESACLLLVACAEAKQILTNKGDELILQIDNQFKKFSAFRKPLKNLTSKSKYLISVG